MPLRRPEPGSFEHLLEEVRVVPSTLYRFSRYPDTELWWSHDASRFDGPAKGSPDAFGTCYAARDYATAFAETVIHECSWFTNGRYEVPRSQLTSRWVIRFEMRASEKRDLVLADFTGEALKRLGLNNDISSGDDYALPQAWARAIHRTDKKWDGIRYISRQHNDEVVYALFQRSGLKRGRVRPLQGLALDRLCDQFKVVAV